MHRLLAALVICAVLTGACTGGDTSDPSDDATAIFSESAADAAASASPTPSASSAASPSATEERSTDQDEPATDEGASDDQAADEPTGAVDVTTTPDVITEEWAEAVINTLLAEYGDIVSEVLSLPVLESPDKLPPDIIPRVEALFDGQFEERRVAEVGRFATELEVRERLVPAAQYVGPRVHLLQLKAADPSCIVVVAEVDASGTTGDGVVDVIGAWSLSPSAEVDNPTEWVIVDQLANTDPNGNELPDDLMIEAEVNDFGTSLENSCEGSA